MTKTATTHPDGSVTTVESRSGWARDCGTALFALALICVVAAPAMYFPWWGKILAWALEALVALVALVGWARRTGRQ